MWQQLLYDSTTQMIVDAYKHPACYENRPLQRSSVNIRKSHYRQQPNMSPPTISANRGSTLPDTEAMGKDQEPQSSWLQKRNITTATRINLKKLSHVRYQHPNLDEIHQFMLDFGLQVAHQTEEQIWYRGYGPNHYVYYAQKGPRKFLGGVFEAASLEDFKR